jgi:hypothetical protein
MTGAFPQVVANLWRMLDAFCDLSGSTTLDGAMGRRLGAASDGSRASVVMPWAEAEARRPGKRAPSALTDFCDRNDPRRDVPQNFRAANSLFRPPFATEKTHRCGRILST